MENSTTEATAKVTATIYTMPVGTVMPYMGTESNLANLVTQGWLPCQGRLVQVNYYKELYQVMGNSCGGDTFNFNLPDLRGVFLRGVNEDANEDPDRASRTPLNAGSNSGNMVGTYQGDQLMRHRHTYAILTPNWDFKIDNRDAEWYPPVERKNIASESAGGNETRPKNVYVYYIIFAGIPQPHKKD